MRIIICIKPIKYELIYPNSKSNESLAINPYELHALNQLLELKQNYDNLEIVCVSMGAQKTEELLRKCIAMGADNAVLLSDEKFSGSDTFITSYILSKAISFLYPFDIVICGKQAVDGETGQVVFGLADRLNIPFITEISQIINIHDEKIICKHTCDDFDEIIEIKTPILLAYSSFTTQMNEISLFMLKKARKKNITIWDSNALSIDNNLCGQKGSKTIVIDVKPNINKKESVVVKGNSLEKAQMIFKLINSVSYGGNLNE